MTVHGCASRERGSGRKLRDQLFGRNDGMSVGRPVDGMGGVHCLLAEGGGGVSFMSVSRAHTAVFGWSDPTDAGVVDRDVDPTSTVADFAG
jgi:hypothetical protein